MIGITGSPVDRLEIHAAARLPYQGVTLRFKRSADQQGRGRTEVEIHVKV